MMLKIIFIVLLVVGSTVEGIQASTRRWWQCGSKERVVPVDIVTPATRAEVFEPGAGCRTEGVAHVVQRHVEAVSGCLASSASMVLSPVALPERLPDCEPYICCDKYDPAKDSGYPSQFGVIDADIPNYTFKINRLNTRAAIRRAAANDVIIIPTNCGYRHVVDLILEDPDSLLAYPVTLEYPIGDPRREIAAAIMQRYLSSEVWYKRMQFMPLQIALNTTDRSNVFMRAICHEVERQKALLKCKSPLCNYKFITSFKDALYDTIFSGKVDQLEHEISAAVRCRAQSLSELLKLAERGSKLRLNEWNAIVYIRRAENMMRCAIDVMYFFEPGLNGTCIARVACEKAAVFVDESGSKTLELTVVMIALLNAIQIEHGNYLMNGGLVYKDAWQSFVLLAEYWLGREIFGALYATFCYHFFAPEQAIASISTGPHCVKPVAMMSEPTLLRGNIADIGNEDDNAELQVFYRISED